MMHFPVDIGHSFCERCYHEGCEHGLKYDVTYRVIFKYCYERMMRGSLKHGLHLNTTTTVHLIVHADAVVCVECQRIYI